LNYDTQYAYLGHVIEIPNRTSLMERTGLLASVKIRWDRTRDATLQFRRPLLLAKAGTFELAIDDDQGTLYAQIETDNGSFSVAKTRWLRMRKWTTITLRYDGTRLDLLTEGIVRASVPAYGKLLVSPSSLFVGHDFMGVVDEVVVADCLGSEYVLPANVRLWTNSVDGRIRWDTQSHLDLTQNSVPPKIGIADPYMSYQLQTDAPAGATTLECTIPVDFPNQPGWLLVDDQLVRYVGIAPDRVTIQGVSGLAQPVAAQSMVSWVRLIEVTTNGRPQRLQ
jgi:hypothetical protein